MILYILQRFVFAPALAYLDKEAETRERVQSASRESEALRAQAEADAKALLESARLDAASIARQAQANAKQEAETLLSQARLDADATRKRAEADQERERAALEEALKAKTLDIALRLNGKLFGQGQNHQAFLEAEWKAAPKA